MSEEEKQRRSEPLVARRRSENLPASKQAGQQLAEAQQACNVSNEQLAAWLHVDSSLVAKWRSGTRGPNPTLPAKLAQLLEQPSLATAWPQAPHAPAGSSATSNSAAGNRAEDVAVRPSSAVPPLGDVDAAPLIPPASSPSAPLLSSSSVPAAVAAAPPSASGAATASASAGEELTGPLRTGVLPEGATEQQTRVGGLRVDQLRVSAPVMRRRRWVVLGAGAAVTIAAVGLVTGMSLAGDGERGASPASSLPPVTDAAARQEAQLPAAQAGTVVVEAVMADGHVASEVGVWTQPSSDTGCEVSSCWAGTRDVAFVTAGQKVAVACQVQGQRIRNGVPGAPHYVDGEVWYLLAASESAAATAAAEGEHAWLSGLFVTGEHTGADGGAVSQVPTCPALR